MCHCLGYWRLAHPLLVHAVLRCHAVALEVWWHGAHGSVHVRPHAAKLVHVRGGRSVLRNWIAVVVVLADWLVATVHSCGTVHAGLRLLMEPARGSVVAGLASWHVVGRSHLRLVVVAAVVHRLLVALEA